MRNKDLKKQKKLLKTKQLLKQFYDQNKEIIEKSIRFCKVNIREHINSIENIFVPFPKNNLEKKRMLSAPVTHVQYKLLYDLSDAVRYFRIRKEIKYAVKEATKVKNRQCFRNLEAIRFMQDELKRYKAAIKKYKYVKGIMKYRKETKRISKKFIENRERAIKILFKDLKKLNKVAKKQFIDDITVHVNAFTDFFFQEMERLNSLNYQITKIILAMDEEIVMRCKCMIKEEPSSCLELPSWKILLEV